MEIIIVGCGKVGSRYANVLSEEGHDVVIIDDDPESFKQLNHDFRGIAINGQPIDKDVLKEAGIQSAEAFAALTPNDNVNIMACQIAQEIYRVPRVLARIQRPERSQIFHQFGLKTICPTDITVECIRALMTDEHLPRELIFGSNTLAFIEKPVEDYMVDGDVDALELDEGTILYGVIIQNEFMFPNSAIRFNKGDKLVLSKVIY
jgi:trk system potassium uptake protein